MKSWLIVYWSSTQAGTTILDLDFWKKLPGQIWEKLV